MNIRLTCVAFAAIPLLAAGCATPGGSSQNSGQSAGSPDKVAWSGRLCGVVGSFANAQRNAPGVDKTNTQTFKDSSIAQIDAAERSANDALGGLKLLEISPIPEGNRVVVALEQGFGQFRDILHSAKEKAQQVNAHDRQAFVSGMQGVQEELKKGSSVNLNARLSEIDSNKDLKAAAQLAPQCQELMKPQQPATTTPR